MSDIRGDDLVCRTERVAVERRPDVGREVPRRAVVLAHLVPFTVLPAGLWRVCLGLGIPMGFSSHALTASDVPGWGTAWTFFLTALTEALALLTLGLVRPWGEVVPDWVPGLRGRRIPPGPVVATAATGGLLLTAIWVFADVPLFRGRVDEFVGGTWSWSVMVACYLPALLWGPLLLTVTYLYHRRRSGAA